MKLRTIVPYLAITFLCLSGCTILSNLDEITILSGYSREKESQHRLVKTIKDHYDALTKVIAEGHISDYKNKEAFVHSFGEPILKKEMNNGSERWLYRYAIYRLAKDKVYVYFDRDGQEVKWEKLTCPKFF